MTGTDLNNGNPMEINGSANDRAIVLSVRPRWSRMLLDGEKVIELRRKFPPIEGQKFGLIIYSSSPISSIEGVAVLERSFSASPNELWPIVSAECKASREEFDTYFLGTNIANAIIIRKAHRLTPPLHLSELRAKMNFRPPVSWRWARPEERFLLEGRFD